MATLEELYRYYLNQPITYVPGSTIGGLSSLTEINRNDAGGDSMGASTVTSINTDPNVTNTTPGTGIMGTNINFSDIGKALGFAMNPTLGIANLVATQVFGKSPMDMAMEAMGIGGFGRTDSDFATAGVFGGDDSSSTGTANATDTGDMGSEAANDAASASAAAGGSGGGGADSAGDGGDGYATGGRIGYAEGGTGPSPDAAETYSEYKARMLEALRKSHGGQKTAYTDVQPDGSSSGISRDLPIEDYFNYMLADAYALGFNPNTGLKFGVDDRGVLTDQYKFKQEMADFKKNSQTTPTEDFSDYLNTTTINTNVQTTPTEDFSDYLNTTTINTIAQTAPTVAEQMISPEDALTPEVPQENPIQKHLDFNEFLKGQGLSQQDYNVLGGYDVAQNLAPGNPILGGAINLASPFYNLMQTFDSAKDTQGNIIKQYVPDMYEDATESGAYYTVPAQKFSDIPGSAARNIQGGLGILTNTQKQQYQDLRNQYETQRQKSAFERFTGAAGPLAENINTAISSLNPFQKQQYMNYAVQNPEQAIAAAQQNKDFLAATQKNIAPATTPAPASMAAGGRVFYLQGGLASLLR
jgi:hypothetical protein